MKAPDKVYVSIGPRQSLVAKGGQTLKSDVEYIRKNALLEWIDEYKNYSSGPSWELLKTHIETL